MILMNLTTQQSLTLSHDLLWIDEHAWSPVTSQVDMTLTGALIIENAVAQAGRHISLQAPDATMAWHQRTTVDQLRTWATLPGQQFRLTLDDGRQFVVVFRHNEPPALEASPVSDMASYAPDDYWQIKIKFLEI